MSVGASLSFEDIYGPGSQASAPESQAQGTEQKTNPNNSSVTGTVSKDQAGIQNIKGNILGQPIIVWVGMIVLLVAVKFIAERE